MSTEEEACPTKQGDGDAQLFTVNVSWLSGETQTVEVMRGEPVAVLRERLAAEKGFDASILRLFDQHGQLLSSTDILDGSVGADFSAVLSSVRFRKEPPADFETETLNDFGTIDKTYMDVDDEGTLAAHIGSQSDARVELSQTFALDALPFNFRVLMPESSDSMHFIYVRKCGVREIYAVVANLPGEYSVALENSCLTVDLPDGSKASESIAFLDDRSDCFDPAAQLQVGMYVYNAPCEVRLLS
eukprot:TRINITY_DN38087_c0_g1_i1.p1 TRINITY_DN38087_c0_g1~~TRINITY_DN38087_c0_g1_i1.p1  ORF type:complete len:244 (-),score=34.24 TRINITY_DN38087_c0_g1_i1:189-920(-)